MTHEFEVTMKTLNITNGDAAANVIKQSTIAGDVLPWRDPMHHGPFPANLSLSELGKTRAAYLAGPDGNAADIERDFQLRDQHLRASDSYDKITLWFEHDLLDQLQILQILDWFCDAGSEGTVLEIICVDRFPGKADFRGIGELTTDQMRSLTELRRPVTDKMLALAASGWAAFRSSDPSDLSAFLDNDLGDLPFLAAALHRHLQEFPHTPTGLNQTETQLLRLMADGIGDPELLFRKNMELETALFIGDWLTYGILDALCTNGLATCAPSPFHFPSFTSEKKAEFNSQRLSLTEIGHQVLGGELDAFELMPRQGWLGGVKIADPSGTWTWDPDTAQILRRANL